MFFLYILILSSIILSTPPYYFLFSPERGGDQSACKYLEKTSAAEVICRRIGDEQAILIAADVLPRGQVEVEAALKPLLDEGGPGRNLPQSRILLRDEGKFATVAFCRGALPLLLLLLCEEVLGWRVV